MIEAPSGAPLPKPSKRRLRVYAFDPNAALERGSASYSQATIALTWNDPTEEAVTPGPVNDYLEVIDIDPVSRQFYEPIDLNDVNVLGQDGLPPSEGDPRFHQQMVFAVAMKTIKLFERALGRKVTWRPAYDTETQTYIPTDRLRVYPHALREANAYYSRDKRALLFGYFKASQRRAGASWIFTALSHDIIVHETTHAILDGLHPRYAEPTSADSLAFHEAFADVAALFSHFQLTEAVYAHIIREGGQLSQSSLLSGLARQFAKGTSERVALRDYIDTDPDPDLLSRSTEPHARGAILVAAIFDAFLTIYTSRSEDLLRIAGIQPSPGQRLHPDLAARLTTEATKSAEHVLRMCIRALDYLPPVDVRFGEFLRAIVTADADLIPDDRLNYRLAFIDAFRRRGIFPDNCLSLSPDNLIWSGAPLGPDGPLKVNDVESGLDLVPRYRRDEVVAVAESNRRRVWYWLLQPELRFAPPGGREPTDVENQRFANFMGRLRGEMPDDKTALLTSLTGDLQWLGVSPPDIAALGATLTSARTDFGRWLSLLKFLGDPKRTPNVDPRPDFDRAWEEALGLFFVQPDGGPFTLRDKNGRLAVEVASVRTARRTGPEGQDVRQLVIEVTQRRRGYLDDDRQRAEDENPVKKGEAPPVQDFWFRGGATLIIDLRDRALRYVISKSITNDKRLFEQRTFLNEPARIQMTYHPSARAEPFALLHRS
jgi:hypothetical protein